MNRPFGFAVAMICFSLTSTEFHPFNKIKHPLFLSDVKRKASLLVKGLLDIEERLKQNSSDNDRVQILEIRSVGYDHKLRNYQTAQSLMIGVTLNINVSHIISTAADKGLILISAGEKIIRIVPPLIISDEEIKRALHIMEQVFTHCKCESNADALVYKDAFVSLGLGKAAS